MRQERQHLIYDFLLGMRFRIWRHILLILVIAFVATSGVLSVFGESYPILGSKIYCILLLSLVLDLVIIYFNLYILVPRLLLKGKYLQYILVLFVSVFIFLLINMGGEYCIFKHENIIFEESSPFYSKVNLIIEFLTSFVTYTILIVSISMTRLFENWLINVQRVSQLEVKDLRSQLEDMKEKVSPSFLSRILKRTASLAVSEPQESSDMLLKLSKILRYQLYDCSRDKVLLSSEIIFLTNYLNLEKAYFNNFDFEIDKNGDISHVFIPALLFLPFIQESILHIQKQNKKPILKLYFGAENGELEFTLDNGTVYTNYSDTSHRLELLYPNQYSFKVKEGEKLSIQIKI